MTDQPNNGPQQEPDEELAQFLLDHQVQNPPVESPKVSKSLLDKILRKR